MIIIPCGVDRATAGSKIFLSNNIVTGEELSAVMNYAIRGLNGGLMDVNVRPIEGAYTGIAESYIDLADRTEAGHNHDGYNSAPIGAASVDQTALGTGLSFLRAPYAALGDGGGDPLEEKLFIACGRVYTRNNAASPANPISLPVTIPFDNNVITSIQNPRVVVSFGFVVIDVSKRIVDHLLKVRFDSASHTTDFTKGYISFLVEIDMPILAVEEEDAYYIVQWLYMAEATFANPTG